MSKVNRIIACVVFVLSMCLRAGAQELPADPQIVSGELDNGLRYIVQKHSVPPGRAVVWIHMHTGSLNETEQQRGIAHYLEHMAFNGSDHFKPGELIPFFESMGMTFGRDQNAFTSYDQTTYQLSLPNTKPETLAKGMTFFADVMTSLSLLPSEIDNERQIILEERRRGLSARQRTNDYVMQHLIPGSIFGLRSPIGTEETVKAMKQSDFKDYYGKWYGAASATVMVVADTDPEAVIKAIKDAFGGAPKRPRPTPQELNIQPYDHSFAIVASDKELRSAEVRIVKIAKANPPVKTVQQYRDDLVLRLGISAMNRRLGEKSSANTEPYLNARVSSDDDANVLHSTEINARSNPAKWKDSLNAIAMELQRARAFGFTTHELDRVKTDLVSGAERAVETEATTPAQGLISRMNNAVASNEPIRSPQQRLDLLNELLPKITPEEIAKRFDTEFDMKACAFVAVLPSSASIPSDSELLELGTKALAVTPTAEDEAVHTAELMTDPPAGGKVVEGEEHAGSQVWSGWLSNNVHVYYRFMDQRKDDASITITLIGGELLETAANRGITQAAQLAWSRPATESLSSSDIRELMTGKKVSVRGGGGFGGGRGRGGRGGGGGGAGAGDSISLTVSGRTEELETGMQLAYLLLTQPKIEDAGFTQFQTNTREMLQEMNTNPMMVGARAAAVAPYPDSEIRVQPMTVEQLDKLSIDAAQAWLVKLLKDSPIEVVIVGDIDKDKALELVTKYIGSLPSREKVSPTAYADLRKIQRPTGPRIIEKTVDTPTNQAFVYSGFYGADESNRNDVRALGMAARILSTRMIREVREESQLVYSIGASSRAGSTYPGFGVFSAGAPTDPEKADALVAKIASMYDEFAKDGPSAEEIDVARKQFANTYAEQLKEPAFWSSRLRNLGFRGRSLDELVEEPNAYQAITASEVKDVFDKYYAKDNVIVVVVKPDVVQPATKPTDPGK